MRAVAGVAVALLVTLGGCSCSEEPPKVEPLSDRELAKLPAVTPEELQALLEAQKGKLVALVVWSVRREDCVALYPRLSELAQGRDADLTILAVSIDRVSDVREKALPLVEQHGGKWLNRVVRAGPEALAAFVGTDWSGQVPAIALLGRDGRPAGTFYGGTALAKAQARLRELLGAR
jgi:hypothetical protein